MDADTDIPQGYEIRQTPEGWWDVTGPSGFRQRLDTWQECFEAAVDDAAGLPSVSLHDFA